MFPAFALLAMMPDPDPELILAAVVDRYSRVQSVEAKVVHSGIAAETADGKQFRFVWNGKKNFELKVLEGNKFGPLYRGDGRDVWLIYPDGRKIKANSEQKPGFVLRWEQTGGLLFSLVEQAPVIKELMTTPRSSSREYSWGALTEFEGQKIRELRIETNPIQPEVEGQQTPPPTPIRLSLYLHEYRPELIAYSFGSDPEKHLTVYRDVVLKP